MSHGEKSRQDMYPGAMPCHLGAAYYDSFQGGAALADVIRAVGQVAGGMGEQRGTATSVSQLASGGAAHPHGRPHISLTAGELMTTPAVTIRLDAAVAAAARVMNRAEISK